MLTLGDISVPCKQILCFLIRPRVFTCPEGVELPLINYKPPLVNYFVVCHVGRTPHATVHFFLISKCSNKPIYDKFPSFSCYEKKITCTNIPEKDLFVLHTSLCVTNGRFAFQGRSPSVLQCLISSAREPVC